MPRRYHTSFIGREPELKELHDWLAGPNRLASIVSPGGFGKSRLVAEFLESLPPETRAVAIWEDEGIEAVGLLEVLLTTLPPPEQHAQRQQPLEQLALEALRTLRPALIVLDGVEGHLDEARALAKLFLRELDDTKILVTSRVALELDNERWIALSPLNAGANGDAHRLLMERCGDYGLLLSAGDGGALGRIVRHIDGVPLAIEMVAARLRVVGAEELLGFLGESLEALGNTHATQSGRHKNMRDVIRWSLDHLDTNTRRAVAQLSILARGFTVATAAAVLGCGSAVALELIDTLSRAGLVRRATPLTTSTRYLLYGAVQREARLLLDKSERNQTERRVIRELLSLADDPARLALELKSLAAMWPELQRISDDGFESATVTTVERLQAVILLAEVADRFGWRASVVSRIDEMADSESLFSAPDDLVARALVLQARASAALGRRDDMERQVERLSGLSMTSELELQVRLLRAVVLRNRSEIARARKELTEIFDCEGKEHPALRLRAGGYLLSTQLATDDTQDLISTSKTVIGLARDLEEWGRLTLALCYRSNALLNIDSVDEARESVDQAHSIIKQHELSPSFEALATYCSALVAIHDQQLGSAVELAHTAREIFLESGQPENASMAQSVAAAAYCHAGEWRPAIRACDELLTSADSRMKMIGHGMIAAASTALGDLGARDLHLDAAAAIGQVSPVFDEARRILALSREIDTALSHDEIRAELADGGARLSGPARIAMITVERVLRCRFHVAGELRVQQGVRTVELPGGDAVELGGAKIRKMLELLARHRIFWPGSPLDSNLLQERVWPDKASLSSKQNRLRVGIAKLRKSLPGVPIENVEHGYRIPLSVPVVLEE